MKSIFNVIQALTVIGSVMLFLACDDTHKEQLQTIQAMIDSHPDSALIALEEFDLPNHTGKDVEALYGLLLTQARYKNYIDEDNDSLIRNSAEYFLKAGDERNAGMSMFQMGMILLNAQRYGEAAVTLEKGLDIGRHNGMHDIEAYCARGLNSLYNRLFDGAQQVKYARMAYEAFMADGDLDRANYARLNFVIAMVNHEQFDMALSEADELLDIASKSGDTALLAETYRAKALSEFGLDRKREAVADYIRVHELDSTKLTYDDLCNIMIAIDGMDTVPQGARAVIAPLMDEDGPGAPFELLAAQGRYEEAYADLRRYRQRQDSILSALTRSTASEAVMSYREHELALHREQMRSERMMWVLIVVCVLSLGLWCVGSVRRKMRDNQKRQDALIKDAESLRSDFLYQVEVNKNISDNLRDLFRQAYTVVDRLCSAYYESSESKNDKKRVVKEVEEMIGRLSNDTSNLLQLQERADRYTDGLCTSFRKDFPKLKEADYRLFLYLVLGFSTRSISLLLSEKIEVIYNRKSRLKAKIKDSNLEDMEKYLALFGGR